MLTLAKNLDNDIFAKAGQLAIAEGSECRTVIVDSIVRTQRGELQFNPNRGIDYFGTVFRNPKYIAIWAGQVRRAIQNIDWVKDIDDFTYSFDSNLGAVKWSMTISSKYGDSVSADSTGNCLFQKGDNIMGIRWEDIVDKPDGLDEAINRLLSLKAVMARVNRLNDSSSLGDTKGTVNEIRDNIAGDR